MLIVKVDKYSNIEKALKELKGKVIRTKQANKLVERKEYEKKSVRRRKQLKRAKYVQKLKQNNI